MKDPNSYGGDMINEEKPKHVEPNVPLRYAPAGYRFIKTIYIDIEDWGDDDIIAVHKPTDIWASGEQGSGVAVGLLKQQLVNLYDDLTAAPDETLGKLPLQWKEFLLNHIEKIDDETK